MKCQVEVIMPLVGVDRFERRAYDLEAENAADAICMAFDQLEVEGIDLKRCQSLAVVGKPFPEGSYMHTREVAACAA